MPKYQTISVDEPSFLAFVNSPSKTLLNKFMRALKSNKQANSFFREQPPAWAKDMAAWVIGHLLNLDWYGNLTEPEAVAWDTAVDTIVTEFTNQIEGTEHGEIHTQLFELAEEVFKGAEANRQILRMTPYRFHSLAPSIEEVEPVDRVYWPTHAMLDTQQLAALAGDLKVFLTRLPDFEITGADIFRTIDERRECTEADARDLLRYVDRLIDAKAMWYARVDC